MADKQQLPEIKKHMTVWYMVKYIIPPPPLSPPKLLPPGLGGEFHNLKSGHNEHHKNARPYLP